MSATYSTGSSTIIGTVAAGCPQPSVLQIQKVYSSGTSGESLTGGTGKKLFDVTGGKKFYMTGFCLTIGATSGYEFRDSTTAGGGTSLFSNLANGNLHMVAFTSPIVFATAVYFLNATTGTCYIAVTGYEA
jgi:hypothetical protein